MVGLVRSQTRFVLRPCWLGSTDAAQNLEVR